MSQTRESRKSETVAASSLSMENQLLADIDESINYGDDDDESQLKDDIVTLQQLSCAKVFSKFHSRMKRDADTDESIGDYLKALLAMKLQHCKNEFLDGDNQEQQIGNYYKDRLEEYSTLSKQEFLTLAELYKSHIHHIIDK